jgi:predicted O-methyltransferase YrrM
MDLFLAITLYDGKIFGKCSESILKNCIYLMKAGHTVTPFYCSDLYIDHARNICVNLFLDSPCSDLIFIDSDLEFDDDAILKLIKHDKGIVAGSYRYKKDEEQYSTILDFSRNGNCKEEKTGLVYATVAPTGLMRINRNVFEDMGKHYGLKPDSQGIIPFFGTGVLCKDNHWYGEDAFFCKRWREMGGEIFVEPRITITHYGSQEYKGNYHEYLMARSVERVDFDGVETGIPGWMTEPEMAVLRYLASKSESVVEVGSWKGRSTKQLLESCKGTVYGVDTWQGSKDSILTIPAQLESVYAEFIQNVGHYKNLQILKGLSVDMAQNFNGNRVDMVFIDAGHSYEDCKADIEAWLPKCKKIIAGHDYCDQFPGVMQAVNERFPKVNVVDSIWWTEL